MLEPQGVVEIKFRPPELIATMHRIDPLILKLKVGGRAPGDGGEARGGLGGMLSCTLVGHTPQVRPRTHTCGP